MENIIEMAKANIQKDFRIGGKNYYCDIDSDDTLFITVEVARDDWEVLIDNIKM